MTLGKFGFTERLHTLFNGNETGYPMRCRFVKALGSSLPEAEVAALLLFATSTPLAVGKLNGMIHLNFSSGTVKVPVIGMVKPIIQVVPEEITFFPRSAKRMERLVMLRSGDGRAFEVLSAELSEGSES